MKEELGLLSLLHSGRPEVRGHDRFPVDLIQMRDFLAKLGVRGASVGQRECATTPLLSRPTHRFVQVGFQMDDRSLPATIREVGVVRHMDQVQHDRPRAEVERDVISYRVPRVTLHREFQTPFLDGSHPDG